jgi:hypothetical protein
MRSAYEEVSRKAKRPRRRPRLRYEDIIKTDVKDVGHVSWLSIGYSG